MRKIYFFLPDYPKWLTGGYKYHTILFEYFKLRRESVFFFGKHKLSNFFEKSKLLKIVSGLYYYIKIPKNSVLIMSNASFLNFIIPVYLGRIWKNHYYFLIVHHLVQDEKKSVLRKKLEDDFIKKANTIITVSNTTRKRLKDLNLNLKNIEVFTPGIDKVNSTAKSKEDSSVIRLLYVGSIEKRKGLLYLIDAIKLITFKNIELNIVGEELNSKDYYQMILVKIKESGFKDKINLLGKITKEELNRLYNESYIFIFPSLWEGYGMVVAEAMTHGLPVISSKIPSVEEIIDDGVNGLLVEVKNSDQIADSINRIINDKSFYNTLSENARKKSFSFPSWEETSHNILQRIEQIT